MNKLINGEAATRIPTNLIKDLLCYYGEDIHREGLVETPERVAKMYHEVLSGYKENPDSIFKTFSSQGFNQLITVANIDFYSLCEHHLVPFYGKVHIGYVPNGRILGLSKFARLVNIFARRLQTQEHLTKQIFDNLVANLKPTGCIVQIEAKHLCILMRGVKSNADFTTTLRNNFFTERADMVDLFHRQTSLSPKSVKAKNENN